jgi:hypothetical protein
VGLKETVMMILEFRDYDKIPVGGLLAWRCECGDTCCCTQWHIHRRMQEAGSPYGQWQSVWGGQTIQAPWMIDLTDQHDELLRECLTVGAAVLSRDRYLLELTGHIAREE